MSDEKVVGAIKHGNEEAINHVITKYSKLMWSIASSILHNVASDQDIEECVADVFVYLWKHPEKYDPQRGTLKVWLSVVARSQAIDKYRDLSKNNAVPLDDTVFIEQTDICDGMMDSETKRSGGGGYWLFFADPGRRGAALEPEDPGRGYDGDADPDAPGDRGPERDRHADNKRRRLRTWVSEKRMWPPEAVTR